MIEVRNLSKKYDDKTVVHNVSLKIEKGKWIRNYNESKEQTKLNKEALESNGRT